MGTRAGCWGGWAFSWRNEQTAAFAYWNRHAFGLALLPRPWMFLRSGMGRLPGRGPRIECCRRVDAALAEDRQVRSDVGHCCACAR